MRSSAIIEFDISRYILVLSYWMTFGISAICSAHNACCDVKRKFKSALGLEVLLGRFIFLHVDIYMLNVLRRSILEPSSVQKGGKAQEIVVDADS